MPTRPPHVCFIGKSRISSWERYKGRCDGKFGDLKIELHETEERLLTELRTLRRGLRGTQDGGQIGDPVTIPTVNFEIIQVGEKGQ